MTSTRRHTLLGALAALLIAGAAAPDSAAAQERDSGDFVWSGKLIERSKGLDSDNAQERIAAIQELKNFPANLVVPMLIEALDDPTPTVRLAAITALSELGARAAAPRVAKMLESRRVDIRVEAADALGNFADRGVVDDLVGALNDRDADVRAAAIRSLGKLRDPTTISAITGMLSDEAKIVIVEALRVLSSFGDQTTVYAVLDKLHDTSNDIRTAAIEALGELRDPRATGALLKILQRGTRDHSAAAIDAIRLIRDPESVEPLHMLLDPKTENGLMYPIMITLGDIGDARSVRPLLRMLHHGEHENVVIQSVARIGQPAVPILIEELAFTEEPRYQQQLLEMLAKIPSQDSADFLTSALDSEQFPLETTVSAVAQIQDPDMLGVLALALPHLEERTLVGVLNRISNIADDRVVRPLVELYPRASYELRKQILATFASVGHEGALPIVLDELLSDDLEILLRATYAAQNIGSERAVEPLTDLLSADHLRVRHDAAFALGAIGGKDAIARLLETARDEDNRANIFASWALSLAVRGEDVPEVRDFVFETLEDPQHPLAYTALDILGTLKLRGHHALLEQVFRRGRIGLRRKVLEVIAFIDDPAAAPIVALGLEAEDASVRAEAAWAAGWLGLSQFEDPLLALAADPARHVAINAITSLGRLRSAGAREGLHVYLWDRDPYLQAATVWSLQQLEALPETLDLELLLTRTGNPFLKERLYRVLLDRDSERATHFLARERNRALRERLQSDDDSAPADDWIVFDLEPDLGPQTTTHQPAIGERIYLMLPDGSVKAAFSDENGKLRLELREAGEVLQAYGKARFEGNLFGVEPR